ncbi:TolC family protein [Acinetobacter sp. CAAS 2-6]|uniref:TolC family protein n=1 Tax=Acinetobacter sp. CAAS 2-6 TaxID=3016358 RepID=UPI002DD661AB|nr:TolC family protein [Acinetobacter sp. CAAS 2-6]
MKKISAHLFYGILGILLSNSAFANIDYTGIEQALPKTIEVETSLKQHPFILTALSEKDYATAYHQQLKIGEHPWTFKTGMQLRRSDVGNTESSSNSYEPNIGIEKQLRLPNKVRLDRDIGERALTIADLKYGDAWHEASKELLSNWFAYLRTLTRVSRTQEHLDILQNQLNVLDKRVQAGDAARLEFMLLNNELLQLKEELVQLQTELKQSKQSLARYFQGAIPSHFSTQNIQPQPIPYRYQEWIETVLKENHELELAQKQAQQQHTLAQRQFANKIPNPTIGLGYSREQSGDENLISFSVSIPLAGSQVRAATNMAQAEARKADIEVEKIKSRLENDTKIIYSYLQDAQARISQSQQITAALASQDQMMNKAYKLGEITLNEWLLHSRQWIDGKTRLDQAKIDYAQNYALLLLNSHLLWPAHEER